ncbi:dTDP-4-dehydrorhamnose 3,5-epimerase [Simiduia curdlanivorans]|uniref:dTDP-4-dehydrorhamnose 3,5-epimerase n=1 Tax=Simiduia curdlanivorans TaxID=1492769 RepID=A0ABV8V7S3_9GAMM|nr:dTDP-4-dehydrorhamnose 3,5-epimerase [Simiduia curdlanivorans]MDN3639927.1 dTDP-4-dehydrorhamnose 3,5-epimerase [Simiduia curdlanivorans]
MKIINTAIPSVKILEPVVFHDERGFFTEAFRDNWFRSNVADVTFVQDNLVRSKRGVLRGMHYQMEQSQGKLIKVTEGEVFDVVIDLRQASDTYGHWLGVTLSAQNKRQLWVPEGFAHGYLALSTHTNLDYRCTNYYHPESEVAIKWDDSDLAIAWPLETNQKPLLSVKDACAIPFQLAPKFKC